MEYHVLNGDALKDKFPNSIKGERIILRECLVDGPVHGNTIEAIYKTREDYLNTLYSDIDSPVYKIDVIPELNKLRTIKQGDIVYLWFEEDLFCQVNLWFALYLLKTSKAELYLILPFSNSQYGFGSMYTIDLAKVYTDKIEIKSSSGWFDLWPAYQNNDIKRLERIGEQFATTCPFLQKSIEAHKDRNLNTGLLGRPEKGLIEIIKELNNSGFGSVFQEFCKKEAIYGFGDMHVKRLYDKVMNMMSSERK